MPKQVKLVERVSCVWECRVNFEPEDAYKSAKDGMRMAFCFLSSTLVIDILPCCIYIMSAMREDDNTFSFCTTAARSTAAIRWRDRLEAALGLGSAVFKRSVFGLLETHVSTATSKLALQVQSTFPDGEIPNVTKMDVGIIWDRPDPLFVEGRLEHRTVGLSEILFGPATAFWPPPLSLGEVAAEKWDFMEEWCWKEEGGAALSDADGVTILEHVGALLGGGATVVAVARLVTKGGKGLQEYMLQVAGGKSLGAGEVVILGRTLKKVARCDVCAAQGPLVPFHLPTACPMVARRNKARRREGYKPITVTIDERGLTSIGREFALEDVDPPLAIREIRGQLADLTKRLEKLEAGNAQHKGKKRPADAASAKPGPSKKNKPNAAKGSATTAASGSKAPGETAAADKPKGKKGKKKASGGGATAWPSGSS